jgi:hypothetical protein
MSAGDREPQWIGNSANLTGYDAAYVALAESLGRELLTGDQRLANAPGSDAADLTRTVDSLTAARRRPRGDSAKRRTTSPEPREPAVRSRVRG